MQDLSPSYPGTPLRLGSSGEGVLTVQGALNRIAQNYPAIPKVYPVDGLFGPGTEEAVKVFQRIFHLTPDGIVGAATWYQIIAIYVAVTKLAELGSEGQRYQVGSYNIPGALSPGEHRGIRLKAPVYAVGALPVHPGDSGTNHRRGVRHRAPGFRPGLSAVRGP